MYQLIWKTPEQGMAFNGMILSFQRSTPPNTRSTLNKNNRLRVETHRLARRQNVEGPAAAHLSRAARGGGDRAS